MSLESVNDILGVLQKQALWQEPPLQRLLDCWTEVVGKVIAAHTRPLSIQRDILRVATSSAAWAQNLTFGRQQLLLKLNAKLATPLVDIRFSTALWQRPVQEDPQQGFILPREHPSYLGEVSNSRLDVTRVHTSPNKAFRDWAKVIQARSHNLPLCPQCQSPAPPGEFQRWGVCMICAAKELKNGNNNPEFS